MKFILQNSNFDFNKLSFYFREIENITDELNHYTNKSISEAENKTIQRLLDKLSSYNNYLLAGENQL